ncbi:MAG: adenosine kinase, partial [Bacteroidales bacterium]
MKTVLGIGNALVDILIGLRDDELLEKYELPRGSMQLVNHDFVAGLLDETVHLENVVASGGSAANTIHGLSKLGIPTAFLGKVGDDDFGKIFRDDLLKNNITPSLFFGITRTGRAVALVSPDSERTFATFLGASIELSEDDIDSSVFDGYTHFHVEGYLLQNHKLIEKAVRLAKEQQLTVSLDMASFNVVEMNRDFLKSIIDKHVDIVFANEDEARAYTGQEPGEALDTIASECDIAVIKLGKNGSLIKRGNEKHAIGIFNVNSIDTTGAGDLYAAGFLYGLIKDFPLDKCGKIGAILAAKV